MKKTGLSGTMTNMASNGDNSTIFEIDNRAAQNLCGVGNENVNLIDKTLNVRVKMHNDGLIIIGAEADRKKAVKVLKEISKTDNPSKDDVQGAINMLSTKGSSTQINTRKLKLIARTPTQDRMMHALNTNEMVFATGPAGTGKTYLAVVHAVSQLEAGKIEKIILTRPAVEAGERLGFLPGDMKDKVDPYLRPLYDALYDSMKAEDVERLLTTGIIEVAPLAFMRGRTLKDAVVILDEAQNTTSMQMKMFLTRLGENSRMVITGDASQIDLPRGEKSGLIEAVNLLKNVDGISVIEFDEKDVVRHALVGRIVHAYNKADAAKTAPKQETAPAAPKPSLPAPV